jgi:hypothetical protein
MRDGIRGRLDALRTNAVTIGQAAVAAGVAWFLAHDVLGHTSPVFAPIAAIITLGLTFGQRGRRAVEVAIGVAMGIGVGDLIVAVLGTGSWQIALVVVLAMAVAIIAGGGPLLVTQAAISASLVATLPVPDAGISGARFVDCLLGAAIALLVNALIPTDPLRLVRRETEPILAELAGSLSDVADALEHRDRGAAQRALLRARAIDPGADRLRESVRVGLEMAVLAPPRRRMRGQLEVYAQATEQIDHAVRNARVLARGAIRAVELVENVPDGAIEAIRELATAVRALKAELSDGDGSDDAREAALRAAATATAALEESANMSASVIVGQVRSTAVDLLRGLGMDGDDASAAVRDARARLGV